jgi:Kef-type K+ transport system membrane component KefB
MTGHDFSILLLQIVVMLSCGLAGGHVMRRLGQPAVLGEMLAGVLLGPTLFGAVAPGVYQGIFTSSWTAAQWSSGVVRLGMLFFLFFVGLEIQPRRVVRHGRSAVVIGLAGTTVPLIAGAATVYALPHLWGAQAQEHRFVYALFIGAALANTANPVLARILMDLGLLQRGIGALIMTATVVDDVVSWSLAGVVLSQFPRDANGRGGMALGPLAFVALLAAILIVGRWLLLPVLDRARRSLGGSGCLAMLAASILLSGAAAEAVGVHAFLGPFFLGIALAPSAHGMRTVYEPFGKFVVGFFVPLYFVSMGLSANFLTAFDASLVAVVFGVACASKMVAVYLASSASGLDRRTALGVGFGMNARGAIGVILAGLGREHGIINEPVYVALVVMAIATSILAVPTMRRLLVTDAEPSRDVDRPDALPGRSDVGELVS